jgi:hypothetical protein
MLLVLAVPLDSLFLRGFGRHLILGVPFFVHGLFHSSQRYRAIKSISQLSAIADPTNSTKQ